MADHVPVDASLADKRVVTSGGDELGTVSAVRSDTVYVDLDSGLDETLVAKLGWDDVDGEAYPLPADAVDRVSAGTVHLTGL